MITIVLTCKDKQDDMTNNMVMKEMLEIDVRGGKMNKKPVVTNN